MEYQLTCLMVLQRMRKLFLMCQTTGPAETRFLADPLAFWQTHCRCSFAHACGKNGEQWTISRSQGPVMDGCLPDPDKKYPLRSDGPANFAFSGLGKSPTAYLKLKQGMHKETAPLLVSSCACSCKQGKNNPLCNSASWLGNHCRTPGWQNLVHSHFPQFKSSKLYCF